MWCSVIGWMGSQVLKAHSSSSTAWHLTMVAWCSFEAFESQSHDTASHPRRAEFFNYATTILSVINMFQIYFFIVLPPSDFKYKIIPSLLIRMWHLDIVLNLLLIELWLFIILMCCISSMLPALSSFTTIIIIIIIIWYPRDPPEWI